MFLTLFAFLFVKHYLRRLPNDFILNLSEACPLAPYHRKSLIIFQAASSPADWLLLVEISSASSVAPGWLLIESFCTPLAFQIQLPKTERETKARQCFFAALKEWGNRSQKLEIPGVNRDRIVGGPIEEGMEWASFEVAPIAI